MKKLTLYAILLLIGSIIGYFMIDRSSSNTEVKTEGDVIIEKIKSVRKLIVTEGYFSEVYNYKEAKKYFYNLISFEKKALLLIKGKVNISYDLEKMEYKVLEKEKLIKITQLPDAELIIEPNIKYYDLRESTFNTFESEDYNKLNRLAIEKLKNEVEKSGLTKTAEKSLQKALEELQWYGKELGWKVELPNKT